MGLLAFAAVSLTSPITPSAQAQEFEGNVSGDYPRAVKKWLDEPDDTVNRYNLGVAYYQGIGVFEDRAEAAKWWRLAALRGHQPSQFYLARTFANGDGVEQNLVAAHVWYNLIATIKGDSDARQARNAIQNNLSPTQKSEAQRLAKQCLDSNYRTCLTSTAPAQKIAQERREAQAAEAQRRAQLSPLERGVEAYYAWNYATALRELRPLAESGNAEAQYYLALMYDRGVGVAEDDAKALEWYYKAAMQGHASAQLELGNRYKYGWGVRKNLQTAYVWYTLAIANGKGVTLSLARGSRDDEDGFKGKPDGIRHYMSNSQIRAAERTAQKCLDSNYSTTVCPGLR